MPTLDNLVQFLLVPDSGAARRLRRELASGSACTGIVVGVWPELMSLALDTFLIEPGNDDWQERLHHGLGEVNGAFWSQSYSVSPAETASVIAKAYCQLVQEAESEKSLLSLKKLKLPARAKRHLKDLLQLHTALSGALPQDLAAVQSLLAVGSDEAVRGIAVYYSDGVPRLSQWQRALIDHLNTICGAERDNAFQAMLDNLLTESGLATDKNGSLAALQEHLFSMPEQKFDLDASLQWLGARDFLEEAEVAAGMAQSLLDDDPGLCPADIGVLIPEKFEYDVALGDAFQLGGLPLAGLPRERWHRDLGQEAVFHFLYCRQKPSPAMAVASCLTSPLMPWDLAAGSRIAQKVIDGDWELKPWAEASAQAGKMLDLLRAGDKKPATLMTALRRFVGLLDVGDGLEADIERARLAADRLCAVLEQGEALDWHALRHLVMPEHIPTGDSPEYSLEGVTVWREGQEPWRQVRHLMVLGFAAGHYPRRAGLSAVFSAADMDALANASGLSLDTPSSRLARTRALFKRQLNAVAYSVSFLIPRRDPAGEAQSPAESLQFMLHMFDREEDQILNLDISEDRKRVLHLVELEDDTYQIPIIPPYGDLQLGRDLLTLRLDEDGKPRPESPSALETLMVSPLAWLLQRLNAEPLLWAPEDANVLLLGTLSHSVFEQVFSEDGPIPTRAALPKLVSKTLQASIKSSAPFLNSPSWQVERRLLEAQLQRAAEVWRTMLTQLKAEVIGTEIWLAGQLDKIGIHGQADALLALPGNRLLIVDYKKSSSSSRRPRMERGYDNQVNLYRLMVQTGGLKDAERADLDARLKGCAQAGIVYFNMNDTTALTDTGLDESAQVPGWEVLENDVSAEAMALIGSRIVGLKAGRVPLNKVDDAEFFEKKAGVKPYALERTPLTSLFSLPTGEVK